MPVAWNLPAARQVVGGGTPGVSLMYAPVSQGYTPQQQQIGSPLNAQRLAAAQLQMQQAAQAAATATPGGGQRMVTLQNGRQVTESEFNRMFGRYRGAFGSNYNNMYNQGGGGNRSAGGGYSSSSSRATGSQGLG